MVTTDQNNGVVIAIVGATGLLGEAVLELLSASTVAVGKIHALASEKSGGDTVMFRGKPVAVTPVADFDFGVCQVALFVASAEVSATYAQAAADKGCYVIDASGHFSADSDVPLIVAGLNTAALGDSGSRIFAVPGVVAMLAARVLKPLADTVGVSEIHLTGILSVSAAGRQAVSELAGQTARLLNGQPAEPAVFSEQIAFNVLPQNPGQDAGDYSVDELRIMVELPRLLDNTSVIVQPSLIWASVFYGHSVIIDALLDETINAKAAAKSIAAVKGNIIRKKDGLNPVGTSAATEFLRFSVPRFHPRQPQRMNLCAVSDNLRGSSAQNLVETAGFLLKSYF